VTNPRFFVSPQPGDHVWVFDKGPHGYARWMVPVKVWEIDGASRAIPVTAVELRNPYVSKAIHPAGYAYTVPAGDYYLYDEKLYDSVGDAFKQWVEEQVKEAGS
jgi:hypothetical protein